MKHTAPPTLTERFTTWIGSRSSLVIHTLVFIAFFMAVWFGLVTFETMLLILTTAVSLEAIYLAIFIQMTVNRNTASLREVEEDIDEIQEDVEEIGEDIDELQEDVEEMSEDIDEIQEDVEELSAEEKEEEAKEIKRKNKLATDAELLNKLSVDIAQLLRDIEELKEK